MRERITTRLLIAVVRCGASIDSSAGPIEGATGKPSVEDDREMRCSLIEDRPTQGGTLCQADTFYSSNVAALPRKTCAPAQLAPAYAFTASDQPNLRLLADVG